ncbi:MAG: putative tricarboxylic transport membrane protein [Granulosicoccus sp.]|jgi:putative tricarboxylic transport membrane protein
MTHQTDRLSGLMVTIVGLLAYFLVIPVAVETVDSGWLLPQSMPNVLAWVLIVSGIALAVKPTDQVGPPGRHLLMFVLYLGLLIGALYAMSLVGFIYIAPLLALLLMGLIGERRPFWLGLGVIVIPALIWVVVVWLLDRNLP